MNIREAGFRGLLLCLFLAACGDAFSGSLNSHFKATDFATGFPSSSNAGPAGIAFQRDKLFVLDTSNNCLYKIDAARGGKAGDALNCLGGSGYRGLASSSEGLFVLQEPSGSVVNLNSKTGEVKGVLAQNIPGARNLAVDPVIGDLYVSGVEDAIFRFKSLRASSIPPKSTSHEVYASLPNTKGQTKSMTFGPEGTMYVASSSSIYRVPYSAQGKAKVESLKLTTPMQGISSLALSPDTKSLLITHEGPKISRLRLSDLDTITVLVGGTPGDNVVFGPDGCAYSPQGDEIVKISGEDGSCAGLDLDISPPDARTIDEVKNPIPKPAQLLEQKLAEAAAELQLLQSKLDPKSVARRQELENFLNTKAKELKRLKREAALRAKADLIKRELKRQIADSKPQELKNVHKELKKLASIISACAGSKSDECAHRILDATQKKEALDEKAAALQREFDLKVKKLKEQARRQLAKASKQFKRRHHHHHGHHGHHDHHHRHGSDKPKSKIAAREQKIDALSQRLNELLAKQDPKSRRIAQQLERRLEHERRKLAASRELASVKRATKDATKLLKRLARELLQLKSQISRFSLRISLLQKQQPVGYQSQVESLQLQLASVVRDMDRLKADYHKADLELKKLTEAKKEALSHLTCKMPSKPTARLTAIATKIARTQQRLERVSLQTGPGVPRARKALADKIFQLKLRKKKVHLRWVNAVKKCQQEKLKSAANALHARFIAEVNHISDLNLKIALAQGVEGEKGQRLLAHLQKELAEAKMRKFGMEVKAREAKMALMKQIDIAIAEARQRKEQAEKRRQKMLKKMAKSLSGKKRHHRRHPHHRHGHRRHHHHGRRRHRRHGHHRHHRHGGHHHHHHGHRAPHHHGHHRHHRRHGRHKHHHKHGHHHHRRHHHGRHKHHHKKHHHDHHEGKHNDAPAQSGEQQHHSGERSHGLKASIKRLLHRVSEEEVGAGQFTPKLSSDPQDGERTEKKKSLKKKDKKAKRTDKKDDSDNEGHESSLAERVSKRLSREFTGTSSGDSQQGVKQSDGEKKNSPKIDNDDEETKRKRKHDENPPHRRHHHGHHGRHRHHHPHGHQHRHHPHQDHQGHHHDHQHKRHHHHRPHGHHKGHHHDHHHRRHRRRHRHRSSSKKLKLLKNVAKANQKLKAAEAQLRKMEAERRAIKIQMKKQALIAKKKAKERRKLEKEAKLLQALATQKKKIKSVVAQRRKLERKSNQLQHSWVKVLGQQERADEERLKLTIREAQRDLQDAAQSDRTKALQGFMQELQAFSQLKDSLAKKDVEDFWRRMQIARELKLNEIRLAGAALASTTVPFGKRNCCARYNPKEAACKAIPNVVPVFQIPHQDHLECLGSLGTGCSRAKPLGNGKVEMKVSVGTIMHSMCCAQYPHGQWCAPGVTDKGLQNLEWDDECACAMEWRKAARNEIEGRSWIVKVPKKGNHDLRPARGGYLPTQLGDHHFTTNHLTETVSTFKMRAPPGTKLDCPKDDVRCKLGYHPEGKVAGDSIYCTSGKFISIHKPAKWGVPYGICAHGRWKGPLPIPFSGVGCRWKCKNPSKTVQKCYTEVHGRVFLREWRNDRYTFFAKSSTGFFAVMNPLHVKNLKLLCGTQKKIRRGPPHWRCRAKLDSNQCRLCDLHLHGHHYRKRKCPGVRWVWTQKTEDGWQTPEREVVARIHQAYIKEREKWGPRWACKGRYHGCKKCKIWLRGVLFMRKSCPHRKRGKWIWFKKIGDKWSTLAAFAVESATRDILKARAAHIKKMRAAGVLPKRIPFRTTFKGWKWRCYRKPKGQHRCVIISPDGDKFVLFFSFGAPTFREVKNKRHKKIKNFKHLSFLRASYEEVLAKASAHFQGLKRHHRHHHPHHLLGRHRRGHKHRYGRRHRHVHGRHRKHHRGHGHHSGHYGAHRHHRKHHRHAHHGQHHEHHHGRKHRHHVHGKHRRHGHRRHGHRRHHRRHGRRHGRYVSRQARLEEIRRLEAVLAEKRAAVKIAADFQLKTILLKELEVIQSKLAAARRRHRKHRHHHGTHPHHHGKHGHHHGKHRHRHHHRKHGRHLHHHGKHGHHHRKHRHHPHSHHRRHHHHRKHGHHHRNHDHHHHHGKHPHHHHRKHGHHHRRHGRHRHRRHHHRKHHHHHSKAEIIRYRNAITRLETKLSGADEAAAPAIRAEIETIRKKLQSLLDRIREHHAHPHHRRHHRHHRRHHRHHRRHQRRHHHEHHPHHKHGHHRHHRKHRHHHGKHPHHRHHHKHSHHNPHHHHHGRHHPHHRHHHKHGEHPHNRHHKHGEHPHHPHHKHGEHPHHPHHKHGEHPHHPHHKHGEHPHHPHRRHHHKHGEHPHHRHHHRKHHHDEHSRHHHRRRHHEAEPHRHHQDEHSRHHQEGEEHTQARREGRHDKPNEEHRESSSHAF